MSFIDNSAKTNWPRVLIVAFLASLTGVGIFAYQWWSIREYSREQTKTEVLKSSEQFITEDPIPYKKSLRHSIKLSDIGTFPKEEGNGADIYLQIVVTTQKQHTELISEEDLDLLFDMARKENFSFYPEHYSIPASPLKLVDMPLVYFNSRSHLITRQAISTAKQVEAEGDIGRAEEILKAILSHGRQLEDAPYVENEQWAVGLEVERIASNELYDFYLRNDMKSKAEMINRYLQEVSLLGTWMEDWEQRAFELLDISRALFEVSEDNGYSISRPLIEAKYKETNTSEAEFHTFLNSLEDAEELIIQVIAVYPLMFLINAQGVEPERTMAEKVLKRYSESENIHVRNLAQGALEVSSAEIIKLFEDN